MNLRSAKAFSLVEMMVAMAVLALVLLLMAGVAGQIGGISQRSSRQIAARQNVRAVFGLIRQDLAAAVMPLDPASQDSFQFVVNPPGISSEYHQPTSLFFHSRVATDASLGNLAAIGYFVRWNDSGGIRRPHLFRFQANAADTGNFLLYQSPAMWIPEAELGRMVMPMAENVAALFVECFRTSPGGELEKVERFDSRIERKLPALVSVSLVTIGGVERGGLEQELAGIYDRASNADELFDLLPERWRRDARVHKANYSPFLDLP